MSGQYDRECSLFEKNFTHKNLILQSKCIADHSRLFFRSAQFEYQQDCTGLNG